MTLLALLLPVRVRAAAANDGSVSARGGTQAEWTFVFSRDGQSVTDEGIAPLSSLPKAERLVLVVQDEDVTWLPARLPKMAAARLKDALGGLLEEQLLEDPSQTHLAVGPKGLKDGEATWIAALHKPWLEQVLADLRAAGLSADSLVGQSEPGPSVLAHARTGADGNAVAVVSGPDGVALMPMAWKGWIARVPEVAKWTAEPSASRTLAEQGLTVQSLMAPAQRTLTAAVNHSNLLQFDLAPRMKGARAMLAAWSAFKEPRLRLLRWGLAGLILVQIIGLNAQAWQTRREISAIQARGERVLREAFPSVTVVVDPMVQMERELAALRRLSGQPGPTDLETWIDMVAGIWAGQTEPLVRLHWDLEGLRMEAAQWPPEFIPVIEDYARQQGWEAKLQGNTLRLSKSGGR